MTQAGIERAAERVGLACRALAAAANDLAVARKRYGHGDGATAEALGSEAERVCELAHDLTRLADSLRLQAAPRGPLAARPPARGRTLAGG